MTWIEVLIILILAISLAVAIIMCVLNYGTGGQWDHMVWLPLGMAFVYVGWKDNQITKE